MDMLSTHSVQRLLIVYNADGGIFNALKDAVWKAARPQTYPCSLCAITYGAVSMHSEWRRFMQSLPLEIVFHHKDDFAESYPDHGFALPAILIETDGASPRELVPAHILDRTEDVPELIRQVETRLVDEQLRPASQKAPV